MKSKRAEEAIERYRKKFTAGFVTKAEEIVQYFKNKER